MHHLPLTLQGHHAKPVGTALRVKDLMSTQIVTVQPTATVRDIAYTLVRHHVSTVPVANGDGKVLGMVSDGDLVRRVHDGASDKPISWWIGHLKDSRTLAKEYVNALARPAREVMTTPAITVSEDEPLSAIAAILETSHIKHIPVVREGALVGIVHAANLMLDVAMSPQEGRSPRDAEDKVIRRRLAKQLALHRWAGTSAPPSPEVPVGREAALERLSTLTPRQRQIMDLVVAGHASKEIAAWLKLSTRTVDNHRAQIKKRTKTRSLPDLVRLVIAAN
jgi:CBS domain-containing protein/DNA-binding CsgD family transcriptional regulator